MCDYYIFLNFPFEDELGMMYKISLSQYVLQYMCPIVQDTNNYTTYSIQQMNGLRWLHSRTPLTAVNRKPVVGAHVIQNPTARVRAHIG